MKRLVNWRSDDEIRMIGELYDSGLGEIRIAKKTGIPFSTVRGILRGDTANARRVLGGRKLQGRRIKPKPECR